MADGKMSVSEWSPEFVQELLPAAKKTALLYHLSYLCLANFPDLERTIRSRAVETRLLFGSSDATMLKCFLTSKNLVQSLFPMLVTAVEKDDADLAVEFLGKARIWIKGIITDVDKVVERYDSHIKDVVSATSDVASTLQKTIKELDEKINRKSQEIQDFVRSITQTKIGLGIFAAIVPFIGPLVKSIYDAVNDPKDAAHLKALEDEYNILIAEKTALKQKQWQVQLQTMDQQMKAAKARGDRDTMFNTIYLSEVQESLTRIQDILVQLKNFWENVAQLLDSLEQTTFAGETFLKKLDKYKDDFLESIKMAKEAWICFGAGCQQASVMFKQQNKDAYKFLEVSPSSLSIEEWEIQYESVKDKLEEIDPPQCVTSSNTPALSE